MLIANKYSVPDSCPPTCIFLEELKHFSQGCTCTRCPVFACKDGIMIDPKDFREDWAKEWVEFFEFGTVPELRFEVENG